MTTRSFAQELARLRTEVGRIVVGYDDTVTDLLIGLLTDGHVLLEGVPGVAKTTLGKTFAEASGLHFRRIQFTQDLLPADITGHYYYNQKSQEFELRRGPVFANVLLADEINRAPPKTQSALLEAMEERQVTIEGQTLSLGHPFIVVATMNPIDVEGVYRLPEAQLDRFMIRTRMTYLDGDRETDMLGRKLQPPTERSVHALEHGIAEAQEAVYKVHAEPAMLRYVRDVGASTREHASITLGASPRAMEHLLQASRAHALLEGRDYVIPDDVKQVAPKVLAHRLILDVDAEIEGRSRESLLNECIGRIDVPKGLQAR